MTSDERAQLIEDIRRSNVKRERIIEQASADESFDLAAAWETLDELERFHQRANSEGACGQVDCELLRRLSRRPGSYCLAGFVGITFSAPCPRASS